MIRNLSRLGTSRRQYIAALRNIAGVRTVYSLLLVLLFLIPNNASGTGEDPWTHFVRIGAYGLSDDNADQIVENAQRDGVFGIEVDNDIEGRYESFLDPEPQNCKRFKRWRRKPTPRETTRSFISREPNASPPMATRHLTHWQRTIPIGCSARSPGEPAIFGGGTAFWIKKGDEDVWVSPYAPEWRKIYMERVRQIAGTGIDGIYVDIPYWMTHFEGWENTWASFDDYTVEAFRKQTGLNAKKDLKIGDFS